MDVLEHPLEAVAFRLYSLQDASAASSAAAWTCLAAAAAGLWCLRSSTPASGTEALKPLEMEAYKAKEVQQPYKTRSSATVRSSPDSAAWTMTVPAPSPKERYTAYYYRDNGRVGFCDVDDEEGDEVEEEEAEEQDDDVYPTSETTTGPFGWDQEVVRARSLPLSPTVAATAEMGRYRSPTAALGSSSSVVRLWDDAGGGEPAAEEQSSGHRRGVLKPERPKREQ